MKLNTNQYNINFGLNSLAPATDGITFGECLAGGGGWTHAMDEIPGIKKMWLLNHDQTALRTNSYHHKDVKVYWADMYVQDEHEMEYVDYIHASIECDQHSNANAGKAKNIGSYMMGWEFFRYVKYLQPLVISIENVPEFKKWAPLNENNEPDKTKIGEEFDKWKKAIMDLGYEYKESIRNAAFDGMPTQRTRFFCFFYRPGIEISFPEYTHSKEGTNGKKKWKACRPHIKTEEHGISIFGRKFNEKLPKQLRRELCDNSQKRIAGGIKKLYPDFYQFLAKYHAGINPERAHTLDEPIKVIDGSNRHQLVTVQNGQFIQDHCQTDNYHLIDDPLKTQLTWQTKQLVNLEKMKFIIDHCHSDKLQELDEPLQPQTSQQSKRLVNVKIDEAFLVQYYGTIQSQNLDAPINAATGRDTHQLVRIEKFQFIAKYFNSGGRPETNVQSIDDPLTAVLGVAKHQLVTLLDDFDIKVRFLDPEELGGCSTFPKGYFTAPDLKLSHKDAVRLIGNAVPPKWAKKLVEPNVGSIIAYKQERLSA